MFAQHQQPNIKVASELRREKVKNAKRTNETPDLHARILCPFYRTNLIPKTTTASAFPTTYKLQPPPPRDAHLPSLRHQHPFHTGNLLIMSTLPLYPKKHEISSLLRHLHPNAHSVTGSYIITTMPRTTYLVLSLLAIACPAAFAQEARATVGGRVTDPQGAIIPEAIIVVTSDDSGVTQKTRTNEAGNWTVQFLLPGHYRFTITAPGFKTESRQGITLQTADNKQIDVQLEIGSSSESVQVTAEAPLIDTTSATSGTVITKEEITEMPSQSHVATLLATLSPGVIQQDQNGNVVRMWSYLGGSQFTADGGRNNTYSNNFQLDGMPNSQHDRRFLSQRRHREHLTI
jgi:hypothetical protein